MSRKIFKLLLSRPRRPGSELFCKATLGSVKAEGLKAKETDQIAAKMRAPNPIKKETHAPEKDIQAA